MSRQTKEVIIGLSVTLLPAFVLPFLVDRATGIYLLNIHWLILVIWVSRK